MRTMKFFWQYFKHYKLSFVIVILMILLSTVLQVLFPIYVGQVVQNLVELGSAFADNQNTERILTVFGGIMWNLFSLFVSVSFQHDLYDPDVSCHFSFDQ